MDKYSKSNKLKAFEFMLSYICPIANCPFKCPTRGIFMSEKKVKPWKQKSYFFNKKSAPDKKVYEELTGDAQNLSYLMIQHLIEEHTDAEMRVWGYNLKFCKLLIEQINDILKVKKINFKATIKSRAKILRHVYDIDV